MILLPEAENRTSGQNTGMWRKDGQTDRRTDGQPDILWLLQRSALRAMRTRCKNTTRMVGFGPGPVTLRYRLMYCERARSWIFVQSLQCLTDSEVFTQQKFLLFFISYTFSSHCFTARNI